MRFNVRESLQAVKKVALYAGLVIGVFAYAPAATAVGGTPAYEVEATSFQWIDASTVPTTFWVPIGFDFRYYGGTYNTLSIADGFLGFGPELITAAYKNTISPLRADFYSTADTRIYTHSDGAAPNRRLTVSWVNLPYRTVADPDCACPTEPYGSVTFQVTLYEGSNDIVFRYLDTIANDTAVIGPDADNGKAAWVGITNADGSGGTLYSHNQATVFSGTALRFFMGTNLSPIANAGTDQVVNEGANVVINGSGSSDSDGIAAYAWAQIYESPYLTIPLETANAATASFVAPLLMSTAVARVPFQLTVTDNKRAYSTDTTNVDIVDLNAHPTITAGPDLTVNAGAAVTLTATASDSDGTIVRYYWYQISGTSVSFTGWNTAVIGFTAPAFDDVLTFSVNASDNEGAGATDYITVTVRAAPVASAGVDQIVKQKTVVTLDGSGSTGNIASYSWRQVAGKTVSLKNPTSARSTFTAPSTDKPTNLTFELTVTDTNGVKATDHVVVTVSRR